MPPAAAEVLQAFNSAKPPPPKVLDAFAAASPFGAALLDGEDPFEATIIEANPALSVLTGGAIGGERFGDLIEASSRTDVSQKLADGHVGALEVRLASRNLITARIEDD